MRIRITTNGKFLSYSQTTPYMQISPVSIDAQGARCHAELCLVFLCHIESIVI